MKVGADVMARVLLMLLATWMLGGCLKPEATGGIPTQQAAKEPEPAAPRIVQVGDRVPDFALRTLDGKQVKLSELQKRSERGVVVLAFWCTTCHSCRHMEEALDRLARDHRGRAAVFAVTANANETAADVVAFLKKSTLALPVVLDPDGAAADLFGATKTTTTVVIDGNAVLRYCGRFRHKDGGSAAEALTAVLAGHEVAIKTTPPGG